MQRKYNENRELFFRTHSKVSLLRAVRYRRKISLSLFALYNHSTCFFIEIFRIKSFGIGAKRRSVCIQSHFCSDVILYFFGKDTTAIKNPFFY